MALKYNGTTIPTTTGVIKYNGTSLSKVIYNGTTVWTKTYDILDNFNSTSKWTLFTYSDGSTSSGTLSVSSTKLTAKLNTVGTNHSGYRTTSKIAIPSYATKLNVTLTTTDGVGDDAAWASFFISVLSTTTTHTKVLDIGYTNYTTATTLSCDISKYAGGSYYIGIFGSYGATITITNLTIT